METNNLSVGVCRAEVDGIPCIIVALPVHDTPVLKEGISKKGNAYSFEELVSGFYKKKLNVDGQEWELNVSCSRNKAVELQSI